MSSDSKSQILRLSTYIQSLKRSKGLQRGFTIVEAMASLTILIIVMVGLNTAMTSALRLHSVQKDRSFAQDIARDVSSKYIRTSDWPDIYPFSGGDWDDYYGTNDPYTLTVYDYRNSETQNAASLATFHLTSLEDDLRRLNNPIVEILIRPVKEGTGYSSSKIQTTVRVRWGADSTTTSTRRQVSLTTFVSAGDVGTAERSDNVPEPIPVSQLNAEGCDSLADCADGHECQGGSCISTTACSDTTNHTDCPSNMLCVSDRCVLNTLTLCETADDCGDGEVCYQGVCAVGTACTDDTECGTDICNEDLGICQTQEACTTDGDCGSGQVCNTVSGLCITDASCNDNSDCQSGETCNTTLGVCEACIADSTSCNAHPSCDPATGGCCSECCSGSSYSNMGDDFCGVSTAPTPTPPAPTPTPACVADGGGCSGSCSECCSGSSYSNMGDKFCGTAPPAPTPTPPAPTPTPPAPTPTPPAPTPPPALTSGSTCKASGCSMTCCTATTCCSLCPSGFTTVHGNSTCN